MNKKLSLLLSLLFVFSICSMSYAQKQKESEGFAEIELQDNMTVEQAKIKVQDAAKINAIENAFGQLVMEGNSLYTLNKQTGEKIEFNQVFNSISDVYVNGEWIKDLTEPKVEKVIKSDQKIYFRAKVKGMVRELKKSVCNFTAKTASCEETKCFTEQFNNDQSLFLHFKSPKSGVLAIYFEVPNEEKTYRLLPYMEQAEKETVLIDADKEYVFFSKTKNTFVEVKKPDELTLTLSNDKTSETNKLYILFSSVEDIGKPILISDKDETIPKYMKSSDFLKWQQESRSRNKDLEFSVIYLSIKP